MNILSTVLKNRLSQSCINKGFRAKDNTMYTYTQQRVGFNYFYGKRQVLEDGIHTIPLDLELCPWPSYDRYLFREHLDNPLCNSYRCCLNIQDLDFVSVDHFLIYCLVKFHQNDHNASEVQKMASWTDIVKYKTQTSVKMGWYGKLPELLMLASKIRTMRIV